MARKMASREPNVTRKPAPENVADAKSGSDQDSKKKKTYKSAHSIGSRKATEKVVTYSESLPYFPEMVQQLLNDREMEPKKASPGKTPPAKSSHAKNATAKSPPAAAANNKPSPKSPHAKTTPAKTTPSSSAKASPAGKSPGGKSSPQKSPANNRSTASGSSSSSSSAQSPKSSPSASSSPTSSTKTTGVKRKISSEKSPEDAPPAKVAKVVQDDQKTTTASQSPGAKKPARSGKHDSKISVAEKLKELSAKAEKLKEQSAKVEKAEGKKKPVSHKKAAVRDKGKKKVSSNPTSAKASPAGKTSSPSPKKPAKKKPRKKKEEKEVPSLLSFIKPRREASMNACAMMDIMFEKIISPKKTPFIKASPELSPDKTPTTKVDDTVVKSAKKKLVFDKMSPKSKSKSKPKPTKKTTTTTSTKKPTPKKAVKAKPRPAAKSKKLAKMKPKKKAAPAPRGRKRTTSRPRAVNIGRVVKRRVVTKRMASINARALISAERDSVKGPSRSSRTDRFCVSWIRPTPSSGRPLHHRSAHWLDGLGNACGMCDPKKDLGDAMVVSGGGGGGCAGGVGGGGVTEISAVAPATTASAVAGGGAAATTYSLPHPHITHAQPPVVLTPPESKHSVSLLPASNNTTLHPSPSMMPLPLLTPVAAAAAAAASQFDKDLLQIDDRPSSVVDVVNAHPPGHLDTNPLMPLTLHHHQHLHQHQQHNQQHQHQHPSSRIEVVGSATPLKAQMMGTTNTTTVNATTAAAAAAAAAGLAGGNFNGNLYTHHHGPPPPPHAHAQPCLAPCPGYAAYSHTEGYVTTSSYQSFSFSGIGTLNAVPMVAPAFRPSAFSVPGYNVNVPYGYFQGPQFYQPVPAPPPLLQAPLPKQPCMVPQHHNNVSFKLPPKVPHGPVRILIHNPDTPQAHHHAAFSSLQEQPAGKGGSNPSDNSVLSKNDNNNNSGLARSISSNNTSSSSSSSSSSSMGKGTNSCGGSSSSGSSASLNSNSSSSQAAGNGGGGGGGNSKRGSDKTSEKAGLNKNDLKKLASSGGGDSNHSNNTKKSDSDAKKKDSNCSSKNVNKTTAAEAKKKGGEGGVGGKKDSGDASSKKQGARTVAPKGNNNKDSKTASAAAKVTAAPKPPKKKSEKKKKGGSQERVEEVEVREETIPEHGWVWLGDPESSKVHTDQPQEERQCYKAIRHSTHGDVIRVRDCVLLRSGGCKSDVPYVAKVGAFWEHPKSKDKMMSLLWYYQPEHTDSGRQPHDMENEVFASRHRDENSVACIDDKCYVLTYDQFCRYQAEMCRVDHNSIPRNCIVPKLDWSKPDVDYPYKELPDQDVNPSTIFCCRKVYDFRMKRILKNPS